MKSKLNHIFIPLTFSILLFLNVGAQQSFDYQVEKYDALHYSEAQKKFRNIHPMPAGVVYIQHPDDGEKEMRNHFKLMKELGFNCLKQIMTVPGWTIEDIQLIALDEGIIPWWYNDAGWEAITDDLLDKLGISKDASIVEIRTDPKMLKYQHNVLKELFR